MMRCWATVADGGPTSHHHLLNVSFLLRCMRFGEVWGCWHGGAWWRRRSVGDKDIREQSPAVCAHIYCRGYLGNSLPPVDTTTSPTSWKCHAQPRRFRFSSSQAIHRLKLFIVSGYLCAPTSQCDHHVNAYKVLITHYLCLRFSILPFFSGFKGDCSKSTACL